MSRQAAVHVLAGTFVLISLVLSITVSLWWLLLTGFVGINLLQSGITGFCPAELVFGKLGLEDAPCRTAANR
jgi:hypothetical protein